MANVLLQPDGTGTCCDCRPNPCDSCGCDEVAAVHEITIQADVSGTLEADELCGGGEFSISASTDTATCNTPTDCVVSCITEEAEITYSCPGDCTNDARTFQAEVVLLWDGGPSDDWFLSVNIRYDSLVMCGTEHEGLGGDISFELNLGLDPSGIHTIGFDDGDVPTVHYDLVIEITPIP